MRRKSKVFAFCFATFVVTDEGGSVLSRGRYYSRDVQRPQSHAPLPLGGE